MAKGQKSRKATTLLEFARDGQHENSPEPGADLGATLLFDDKNGSPYPSRAQFSNGDGSSGVSAQTCRSVPDQPASSPQSSPNSGFRYEPFSKSPPGSPILLWAAAPYSSSQDDLFRVGDEQPSDSWQLEPPALQDMVGLHHATLDTGSTGPDHLSVQAAEEEGPVTTPESYVSQATTGAPDSGSEPVSASPYDNSILSAAKRQRSVDLIGADITRLLKQRRLKPRSQQLVAPLMGPQDDSSTWGTLQHLLSMPRSAPEGGPDRVAADGLFWGTDASNQPTQTYTQQDLGVAPSTPKLYSPAHMPSPSSPASTSCSDQHTDKKEIRLQALRGDVSLSEVMHTVTEEANLLHCLPTHEHWLLQFPADRKRSTRYTALRAGVHSAGLHSPVANRPAQPHSPVAGRQSPRVLPAEMSSPQLTRTPPFTSRSRSCTALSGLVCGPSELASAASSSPFSHGNSQDPGDSCGLSAHFWGRLNANGEVLAVRNSPEQESSSQQKRPAAPLWASLLRSRHPLAPAPPSKRPCLDGCSPGTPPLPRRQLPSPAAPAAATRPTFGFDAQVQYMLKEAQEANAMRALSQAWHRQKQEGCGQGYSHVSSPSLRALAALQAAALAATDPPHFA